MKVRRINLKRTVSRAINNKVLNRCMPIPTIKVSDMSRIFCLRFHLENSIFSPSDHRHSFLVRIESDDAHCRSPLDPSISLNDMTKVPGNKKIDIPDDHHHGKKLFKSASNIHENRKSTSNNICDHEATVINKTSSNSNVFSRLMHSEPHVSYR